MPSSTSSLTAVLCAVLDLADAFWDHVVAHLTSKDCQSLRRTCQLLRHHAAVVEGVSSIEDASSHQAGLRQLRALHQLRLANPTSLFDLHHLSSLTGLTRVVIADTFLLDLRPLHVLASLRSLELEAVEHYNSLSSLRQLANLSLLRTTATSDVVLMRALTQLGLSESSQVSVSQLGVLRRLRSLTIYTDSNC